MIGNWRGQKLKFGRSDHRTREVEGGSDQVRHHRDDFDGQDEPERDLLVRLVGYPRLERHEEPSVTDLNDDDYLQEYRNHCQKR